MRVLLLVLVMALAPGCGGESAPAAPEAPANVTGLITEVRLEGGRIGGFLLESGGESYDLLIDPEFEYGFDLEHLELHRAQKLPVSVDIARRGGKLYAHAVHDA